MQVTNPNNITDTIIVTSQDTKSVSCELSNNGTLFDILSNSLYSDKILAVIREILCNAWDSHIFSNNIDTPLEVTLSETEFSVTDFGSGIDPEKILQIYGTYGQSTKTDDKNATGGFGIGSKAPFAYTDTFTVTNVYKNTKSVYIMTKEPNQAPTIKTIYSGITDEPTGLTVTVLITKKSDYYDFKNKLSTFISKTDIKIKLNGLLQETSDFSNSYCFVKSTSSIINLNVKYNSVIYKVDPTIFHSNSVLVYILIDHNDWFIFNDIVLNALPNTLDISATREALSYTKKTQDTLKILCDNFIDHITKLITENIKDIYKDIHTSKDYFKYIEEMSTFSVENTYISKNEDFIKYLVFFLTKVSSKLRSTSKIHKKILDSIKQSYFLKYLILN
jgi:3D (Asp-Asp-Asp) domain-containing protein